MELDEEDSHLCIRCNQTIIGLQNYVNHRQSNCSSSSQDVKPATKPFPANFDFLNSHGKRKMENYAEFNFDVERDEMDEDEEVETNNKSVAESDFKPYDYDFFSSLQLQYMSKPSTDKDLKILSTKEPDGDEWIDEKKFYNQNESESEDETDESEPEVPRNYTRGKWQPGSRPPNNFTGGKWKPESSKIWDENESSNDGQLDKSLEIEDSNPPPNHTKGKWVPGTKITKLEFKHEKLPEKSERDNFWCSFCSRNLATRAIYERHLKSNLHQKRTKQQNDLEEAAETLPLTNLNELSTHFQQNVEEEGDDEAEIHEIKGEMLDRATTSTPIDEEDLATQRETQREMKKKKFRSRSKVTCEVCDMKLPVHLLGNHLISHFHYRKMLQHPKKSFDSVLDNFHKIIIQSPFQCHPCKFCFNTQEEFLRHWNSIGHVECVESGGGGKFLCSMCKFESVTNGEMTDHLNSAKHQQVVTLINRSRPIIIRRLRSLTCSKCLTEFRYNIQLLQHLNTCEVKSTSKFIFGDTLVCEICQKAFQSALSLQKHQRKAHQKSIFFCLECEITFESAKEAKLHRSTAEHKSVSSRKRMQNDPKLQARLRKICPICKQEKLDKLELKQHILDAHPEHRFSCGRCGMKFPVAQEVSRHVRDKVCKFYSSSKSTQSPTCTVTASSQPQTSSLITSDSDKYGSLTNSNEKVAGSPSGIIVGPTLDLIETNFTDILSPTTFPMPTTSNIAEEHDFGMIIEELGTDGVENPVAEVSFACKLCDFCTNSHAELLFHEILHQLPVDQDPKEKIQCRVCKKFFSSKSLREHLRQHTNERIFECPVSGCPMSFTRKANMRYHVIHVHKNKTESHEPLNVCRICGKKFQSKYILEQHKFIHRSRVEFKTFPCQLPNCIYVGRNATETRNHLQTHSDERLFMCTEPNCDYRGQTMEQLKSHSRKHQEVEFKFSCEHCDYKTKLSSHLKRHMRVHEMEAGKIYKCPHCDYACNNSENLRKHVLKTNRHPGKMLYECIYCDDPTNRFKSNEMKTYQSHLKMAHNMTKKSGGAR